MDEFVKSLTNAREEAKATIEKASECVKDNYDSRKWRSRDYKQGDLVWLEATNLKESRPSKKLSAKQYGPFKVLE